MFGVVVACSSFAEGDGGDTIAPNPDAGTANEAGVQPDATADAPLDGDPDPELGTRFCLRSSVTKNYKVCDDFDDDAELVNGPWTSLDVGGDMTAGNVSLRPNVGGQQIRVTVPAGTTATSAAFLRHFVGTPGKTTAKFGLTVDVKGFSADDYVEIAKMYIPDGPGIGLGFTKNAFVLFVQGGLQKMLSGGAGPRRIVVTIDANGIRATDQSGNLQGEIAGSATFDSPTNVNFGVGLYYTVNAVTTGTTATIDIDDVVIDY